MSPKTIATIVACGILFPPSIGLSADETNSPHLSIELNALQQVEAACQASFLAQNTYETDLNAVVFEAVLFDQEGGVDRLTLLDFGALPSGRTRVRQFLLPDLSCAALGRVLLNGSETCEGEALPGDACTSGLELRSRVDAEMLG
jgi:hypothetical protein